MTRVRHPGRRAAPLAWNVAAVAVAVAVCAALGAACGGGNGASGRDGGADGSMLSGDGASAGDTSTPPGDGPAAAEGAADEAGAPSAPGLRVFYSDLESGPATGGQNGDGAFVTLYGLGFGATRGSSTVTIGGGAAASYPIWSDTRITLQLGGAAKTGDMVAHVASKGDSNPLPFTVRAGDLYFVSSTGDDKADGSFATPWATIPHAKNTIAAGDIAYLGARAGDAVSQTTVDATSSYDCALGMSFNDGTNGGTQASPKALVAYPGAIATVGVETGIERGLLVPAIAGKFDYWVIAGLTLRGAVEAIDMEGEATGWRIVGNDISCPNGTGESGCVTGADGTSPTSLRFYGNVVHDAAANVASTTKYYHGIYFASNDLELGWNIVENGKTCRGIQFHDSGGPNEYGLSVHDNVIHGTVCDGLNFATVDPSKGTIEAYNNVIYDVGLGPDPADGASDYAGIYVAGETDSGSDGKGAVEIYNNTLYGCGSWASSDSGAFNNGGMSPALTMHLVDNLVLVKSGEAYLAKDSAAGLVTGQNNLWFGASGGGPAGFTASVTSDPMLMNAPAFDFHLTSGSPAVGAGTATSALFDFDGTARSPRFDIGAYQHTM